MTRVIVAAVAVLAAVGGGLGEGVRADAASGVQVIASGTARGSSAAGLSAARDTGRALWRSSGRVRGTWIQTSFSRPTVVDATRLSGAGPALRIADARLLFSDGSVIAVHTAADGDRYIPFVPRKVTWVRLVVSRAASGQSAVGLSAWTVHRSAKPIVIHPKGDSARAAAVRTSSGHASATAWTATRTGAGQWIQLRWKRPIEVSGVQIAGGASAAGSSIRAGVLRFSDGSSVAFGTLEPRGGSPTTVAFTARTVTTLRLEVTSLAASSRAAIHRFSVYAVGALPPVPAVSTTTFRTTASAARSCSSVSSAASSPKLVLLCPSNGARVSSRARLVVAGPAGAALSVQAFVPRGSGGSVATVASGRFDDLGTARLSISTRKLVHGPTAVQVTTDGVRTPLYVQIVNGSGVVQKAPESMASRGLELKYDDQFDHPLSVTRSGASAQYASGKPNGYGTDDFGDAIFAQPTRSDGNLATLSGGYLRIRSAALPKGASDPAGYGRKATGGLIASAHLGGSGFSAQYGYFEARMLAPAGAGTWPAFWLLSTGSLYRQRTSTAEVDAVELYGADPRSACQTTHDWIYGGTPRVKAFCAPLTSSQNWALAWHTYGAKVTPTGTDFFVDGVRTGHAPPAVNNSEPFFFLADLALGGGWPVDLTGTNSRVDLYIDSIRVWV